MNWKLILLFLAGIILGGAGVYVYNFNKGQVKCTCNTPAVSTTAISTTTSATQDVSKDLESCLKAKWGEDKYQTIMANPSIATVDDKFNALPCYK